MLSECAWGHLHPAVPLMGPGCSLPFFWAVFTWPDLRCPGRDVKWSGWAAERTQASVGPLPHTTGALVGYTALSRWSKPPPGILPGGLGSPLPQPESMTPLARNS